MDQENESVPRAIQHDEPTLNKRISNQLLTDNSANDLSLCSLSTVNNTLTEAEKDKDKAKETEKDKEKDTYSDKDISKTKEKGQESPTGEKEGVGGKDINSGHENTTAVDREDKYTGTIPEKTVAEGRNEGELGERNTGSERPTGGSKDKVHSKGPWL